MVYLEKLDILEEQLWGVRASIDPSNKGILTELKLLEIELVNIIQFRNEISTFKNLIFEKLGIDVEEYAAHFQNEPY